MNRIWCLILVLLVLSCSKDGTNRNPYLQEIGFRFDINTNLPLYSPLTNTGNPVYIDNQTVGTRGAFVMNTGFDQFRVFEASCPNHAPSDCSTMTIDGQNVVCSCDDFEYSLFTGQFLNRPDDGKRYYDMLEYRASASGNIIIISN
ncbi:hypothetical protein ACEZ3G_07775 [Maribacter algicola]|uniref:Uncharacterized protein n=1 Tax=Meishania litoralis TaxID=3434685 RepID=A0ACC7LK02_9FLAO